ncbi:MAG: hypothetical protein HIU85_05365 [Proteobacteria bacterium]|nr:hypothetical protein [Pseudomonadota bacterium]
MKERLTGAIILVALMVLLVPELLTGPIGGKSPPAGAATVASSTAGSALPAGAAQPAQGEAPLRTYTLTLGTAAGARASGRSSLAPPAARQAQPAQNQPSASSAQETSPSTPGKPAAASAQAPGHGRAARQDAPFKTTAPKTTAPKTTAPKTTATPPAPRPHPHPSPSASRRAAPARAALQVAKPPAHRSVREARTPASSGRWVVQLGVFADHRNALRLAHRLQRKGFRIAVSPLRVRSRSLWRVSTAAPQSRAAALHVAARLRAAGHRGDVLPAR